MGRALTCVGIFITFAGLLGGCSRSPMTAPLAKQSTGTAAARARISDIMTRVPQVIEDRQFESSEVAVLGGAPAGSFAAIKPLRFWRTISHVERSFDIAFSDPDSTGKPTKAVVTVNKILTGTFNIAAGVADGTAADSITVIHKPLEDHWARRLLFVRIPHRGERGEEDEEDVHDGGRDSTSADSSRDDDEDWRLVGTSGVEVTSKAAQTQIVSLRVQATGLDTTLVDPLALFRLRRVLRFDPGDQVTLTVTTLRNDDVVVLLLHGHRVPFANNGDNTYTGSLPLPAEEDVDELRHIGVNAFSHGTLFDDVLPYDSQAWVLPFMVTPNMMAEDLH